MPLSAKNERSFSNEDARGDLRQWFDLILDLQAQGFTPREVKAMVDQGRAANHIETFEKGFTGPNLQNKAWCF